MTMKRNYLCHLLTNRLFVLSILILFSIVVIIGIKIGINRYRIVNSQLYSNLQGVYEIELDSSYVHRTYDVYPFGFIVQIHKNNIRLPTFKNSNSNNNKINSYQDIVKIEKEQNGFWEILSFNPDTIFIDVDSHVLYGKYQVKFVTKKTGHLGYTTANYMYLDNDSTHLCLLRINN